VTAKDWVRVGAPLIGQDAEFLQTLINEAGYPTRLDQIGDTDDGRSVGVMVQRKHLEFAREVRAKSFTEGQVAEPVEAPSRFGLLSLITSSAGFAVGVPLGWLLKGTALIAVMGGATLAMCAFLVTLAFGATMIGDGVKPRTNPPTVQVATRKPGPKR